MKKLGKLFKYKLFWMVTAALFLLFVWPVKQTLNWLGLSNNQYDKIAYSLNLAMMNNGTDEETILELLRPLKAWELEKVYNSFGTRGYRFNGAFSFAKQLNLFEWFSKEFNRIVDRKYLNELREIWSKTNLEITF
nr:hypothetical protein [uncultured Draconibacterium sp.]